MDASQYEDEVRSRWGETEAYRESSRRTSQYSPADFASAKKDQEAATELSVTFICSAHPFDGQKITPYI
jgi:hypothetical protein